MRLGKSFMMKAGLSLAAACAALVHASQVDLMIGSRGYGLGGAYVAIADDPSAGYWNPAGLSYQANVSLMESNWIFQDVTNLNTNYLSAVVPLRNVGVLSAGWLLTSMKLEQGWDSVANAPASTTHASEGTISLSYGRQICGHFLIFEQPSIGLTVNRFYYSASDYGGSGLGLDVGLLTRLPFGFSLGLMARNIAADVKEENVDPEFRLGAGYTGIINGMHRIIVDVDGEYKLNRDYDQSLGVTSNLKMFCGLEYTLLYKQFEFAVRCGGNGMLYNSLNAYGLAFGAGVTFNGYSFQYAYKGASNSDLSTGSEHRLSLVINLSDFFSKARAASDKVPPVVTLNGDSVVTISTRAGSFTDPGAIAHDDVGGNLTKSIIVSGQVNTTVPGTYYVTYAATDAAGNSASVVRRVNVEAADTVAPVITLRGDSAVTVARGEQYVEMGATAIDNRDGKLTNITTSGAVDAKTVGTYTIAYSAADKAGNVATKVRTVRVIPWLFKHFNVPSQQPLATVDTTFARITVAGLGPDLSKVASLKMKWKLDVRKLDAFDFNLRTMEGKGKKARPAKLKEKFIQNFDRSEPTLVLKETGIENFDGEYYAVKSDSGFVLIRTDGNSAIVFKP
ncbi:MAG TPA: PorV/PorQ family protein [Chitinivibrionales bacterium]|nr:PorV/PorQ family protein [Chitinivibrionales bacterium]